MILDLPVRRWWKNMRKLGGLRKLCQRLWHHGTITWPRKLCRTSRPMYCMCQSPLQWKDCFFHPHHALRVPKQLPPSKNVRVLNSAQYICDLNRMLSKMCKILIIQYQSKQHCNFHIETQIMQNIKNNNCFRVYNLKIHKSHCEWGYIYFDSDFLEELLGGWVVSVRRLRWCR